MSCINASKHTGMGSAPLSSYLLHQPLLFPAAILQDGRYDGLLHSFSRLDSSSIGHNSLKIIEGVGGLYPPLIRLSQHPHHVQVQPLISHQRHSRPLLTSQQQLQQQRQQSPVAANPQQKPFTSFSIADILSDRDERDLSPKQASLSPDKFNSSVDENDDHGHFALQDERSHSRTFRNPAGVTGIKRPWDDGSSSRSTGGYSSEGDEGDGYEGDEGEDDVDVDDAKPPVRKSVCPLDALLKMASKTFDANCNSQHDEDGSGSGRHRDGSGGGSGGSKSNKKRRKSRTAFTNKQIYELEKRFVYQKYLTPVDRDEIAQTLGLSNAQVITWFQNRRAKLKRDVEELKADMSAAKTIDPLAPLIAVVAPSSGGPPATIVTPAAPPSFSSSTSTSSAAALLLNLEDLLKGAKSNTLVNRKLKDGNGIAQGFPAVGLRSDAGEPAGGKEENETNSSGRGGGTSCGTAPIETDNVKNCFSSSRRRDNNVAVVVDNNVTISREGNRRSPTETEDRLQSFSGDRRDEKGGEVMEEWSGDRRGEERSRVISDSEVHNDGTIDDVNQPALQTSFRSR